MTNKSKRYANLGKSQSRKKAILIGGLAATATAGAGIGVGYAIWHQKNATIPSTEKLVIDGLQDLAVPFRSTYAYKCKDAKITVDGELPAGFKFDSNTGTLTYSGGKLKFPGSFKLKATAKDGRIASIDVRYYGLSDDDFKNDDNCAFILLNGSVESYEAEVDADGVLILNSGLYTDNSNIVSAIYFKDISGVNKIGDNFLNRCSSLTSIDLSSLKNVTKIGSDFLSRCSSLTSIDLLPLSKVEKIDVYFLSYCSSLTSIDLSPLSKVTTIGDDFLSYCSSLTSIDLSLLSKVTTIGERFLYNCQSLTSIDFSSLSSVTEIGNNFLNYCYSLTSIDLSPLKNVTKIGDECFSRCNSLSSINCSLDKVETIGAFFLANCRSLISINLSKLAYESEQLVIGKTETGSDRCGFLGNCYKLQSIDVGNNDISKFTFKLEGSSTFCRILEGVLNSSENQILGTTASAKTFYDKIATIWGGDDSPISNWSYEGKAIT